MCRWHVFAILMALGTLVTCSSGCAARGKAQQQREDRYQAALASYSEVLKPGMTRKEVEDYLRAKNVTFEHIIGHGLDDPGPWADLIRIGHEHHPWYCEAHNVYVAIHFTKTEPHDNYQAFDSDAVKKLTIFHWLEGCL